MPDKDRGQIDFAITMAGILGQAGCVTLLFIAMALLAGLWLDSRFDSRPIFTVLFVVGSVPVTMYLLLRMVLSKTDRLQSLAERHRGNGGEQEADIGREA